MGQPYDPNRPQQDFMVATLNHQHEQFMAEFKKEVDESKLMVQQFYLSERASLLDNLVRIFAQPYKAAHQASQGGCSLIR